MPPFSTPQCLHLLTNTILPFMLHTHNPTQPEPTHTLMHTMTFFPSLLTNILFTPKTSTPTLTSQSTTYPTPSYTLTIPHALTLLTTKHHPTFCYPSPTLPFNLSPKPCPSPRTMAEILISLPILPHHPISPLIPQVPHLHPRQFLPFSFLHIPNVPIHIQCLSTFKLNLHFYFYQFTYQCTPLPSKSPLYLPLPLSTIPNPSLLPLPSHPIHLHSTPHQNSSST